MLAPTLSLQYCSLSRERLRGNRVEQAGAEMMVAGHLPVEQCAHSKSTNVCVGVIVPPWVSRFYEEAPSDLLWLWSEVTMGGGVSTA